MVSPRRGAHRSPLGTQPHLYNSSVNVSGQGCIQKLVSLGWNGHDEYLALRAVSLEAKLAPPKLSLIVDVDVILLGNICVGN